MKMMSCCFALCISLVTVCASGQQQDDIGPIQVAISPGRTGVVDQFQKVLSQDLQSWGLEVSVIGSTSNPPHAFIQCDSDTRGGVHSVSIRLECLTYMADDAYTSITSVIDSPEGKLLPGMSEARTLIVKALNYQKQHGIEAYKNVVLFLPNEITAKAHEEADRIFRTLEAFDFDTGKVNGLAAQKAKTASSIMIKDSTVE